MQVIKRTGQIEPLYLAKIHRAIEKTGIAVGDKFNKVSERLQSFLKDKDTVTVEDIQDEIEKALMAEKCFAEAKAFILYRNDHHKARIPKCKNFDESFVPEYQVLIDAADRQAIDFYWNHQEIDLTKDIHEFRTRLTPTEQHAVMYLQRLFTQYEGDIGEEYWLGRFGSIFPRHEFRRWGAVAGMTELQVHAPFYQKLNTLLNLEVDGFYTEYKKDPVLRERMFFVGQMINDPDDLVSLAAFTLLEGVVLFSAFAFFKHFQANGKNLLPNFVAGINFSARDEALHAEIGAYCYRTLRDESFLSDLHRKQLEEKIRGVAETLCRHEYLVIENIVPGEGQRKYDGGMSRVYIEGIDNLDMKRFVSGRVHKVLTMLEINAGGYELTGEDVIASWFYDSVEAYNYNDFFAKKGREYSRKWKRNGFIWRNVE